ncbi:alpha/beta hydrolase fold domain-containing protein, partial [uncultured Phyllobacterium sp.]|uniref:alpha/beta hydrolase fold domain-containing protein n=1 Tax=uncultured Phyllobacterium sp. TaxID=253813 RepID=UPI0028064596
MSVAPGFSDELSADMREALLRAERALGPQSDPTLLTPTEGRAQSERANERNNVDLPPLAGATEVVIAADAELGSSACHLRVLVPHGAGAGAVMFVHGGGFAFCSPETHERCARVLANETRMPVLVPDYRLAPEHPFPAGLHDVIACLRAAFTATSPAGVSAGPPELSRGSAGGKFSPPADKPQTKAGRVAPTGGGPVFWPGCCRFSCGALTRFRRWSGVWRGVHQ